MNIRPPQAEPRSDIIDSLRALAARGARVRELADEIVARLDVKSMREYMLPVLWYFMKAFCLPLPRVLPIREWIGTEDDAEIDALILPEIEKSKDKWNTRPTPDTEPALSRAGMT